MKCGRVLEINVFLGIVAIMYGTIKGQLMQERKSVGAEARGRWQGGLVHKIKCNTSTVRDGFFQMLEDSARPDILDNFHLLVNAVVMVADWEGSIVLHAGENDDNPRSIIPIQSILFIYFNHFEQCQCIKEGRWIVRDVDHHLAPVCRL